MKTSIDAAAASLDKEVAQLRSDKTTFEDQLAEHNRKAADEGFRKDVTYYSGMKAKSVKDDFMLMDDADVVRFISAMKSSVAITILDKFKTPKEQQKRLRVMQLLEKAKAIDPQQPDNDRQPSLARR